MHIFSHSHHSHHPPAFVLKLFAAWWRRRLRLDRGQQRLLDEVLSTWRQTRSFMRDIHRDQRQLLSQLLAASELDRNNALQLLLVPERAYRDQLRQLVDAYADFHAALQEPQREQLNRWLQRHAGHHHCVP